MAESIIMYAWAKYDHQRIGGHALDSSFDRYDTEYGWTAADFDAAHGGTLVTYVSVGISLFDSITGKYTDVGYRVGTRDQGLLEFKETNCRFGRLDGKIIDTSVKGSFFTLEGTLVPEDALGNIDYNSVNRTEFANPGDLYERVLDAILIPRLSPDQ